MYVLDFWNFSVWNIVYNQIVLLMKSKKPENTTYPSSKVKKHRSTNNLEIVGIRAAKIQCRARADLHFTISFENQIIFRPMQLYFTVSIWFSHFSCLSSLFSLFSWISIPERKVIRNSLHTLSYQILNTNTIIEWKNYLISKIYHLTGCVRLRVHVGKRHSTPDEKRRGNTWTTVYH